jgi:ribosomal protein L7/L12
MMESQFLTREEWHRIDTLLANNETITALKLYREFTGKSIAAAKEAIGERVRSHFPELWEEYGKIHRY